MDSHDQQPPEWARHIEGEEAMINLQSPTIPKHFKLHLKVTESSLVTQGAKSIFVIEWNSHVNRTS